MRGSAPGAIWPVDDQESAYAREVYARYGLAMYLAQVLEHGTVNAVVLARMLSLAGAFSDQAAWEAAVDTSFTTEFAKTFGNMLRALELVGIPDDLMNKLRDAKAERDRLAHRFFREHAESFLSVDGRTRMIIECENAIERFSAVDQELEGFMHPLRQRYGITEEMVEAHMQALLVAATSNRE